MTLKTAYEKTAFQFGNHGKREVALLNKAFQNIPDNTPADMYGNGEIITAFETKMARFLGKEAALFSQVVPWLNKLPFAFIAMTKRLIKLPIIL